MKVLQFKREQAETEGARRATEGSACSDRSKIPDPEVAEVAKRRRFTAEYKIRILREADACKGDGDRFLFRLCRCWTEDRNKKEDV